MDHLCFCSVLCLLYLCVRLFICALWSPAEKGLTSWLSFVVSICKFVTFPSYSLDSDDVITNVNTVTPLNPLIFLRK